MLRLAYPANKRLPHIFITIIFALYVVLFAVLHERIGSGIASLATVPVIGASWYFGVRGGILTAVLLILANTVILLTGDDPHIEQFTAPGYLIGSASLFLISLVVGSLARVTRERREAILKLEEYERERQAHTTFLESLGSITSRALEADSLESTLKILVERISKLFEADDSFFSLWSEAKQVPIPTVAYGSMRDIYSYIQFEPHDRVPSVFAFEAGQPVAIPDINDSPHIEPKIAAIYPSQSLLVIPLVTQNRKLGSLLLGYNKRRSFIQTEMERAQTAAEQVALVLSKSLLLEEERKQVRQLTALHDIALISIDIDNEDELINRLTDVIGQNLFPDNFGVLLFDEQSGVLHAHPSYRFFAEDERHMMDVPIERGITGLAVRTGRAQRIGNVRQASEYLDVDERTISELCVPIKFKERILGVINAESTKKDAFTEDDERLLVTLAGQIATAIEQIHKAQSERKWLDQLAHSNDLIYALAQITTHMEKAFSTGDIIRNLGEELKKIDLTCIMATYSNDRNLFTVSYTSMDPQLIEIVENNLGYPMITYTFAPDKLGPGNLLYPTVLSSPVDEIQQIFARIPRQGVSDLLSDIGVGPEREPLRLPLVFEENLLGILWIWGENLTKADLPIMSIFAKQIGVSLERARLFQEVQSLALTDHLTGLQNRRSLFELGRVEFSRAHRMHRPFCCMMLDLDNFKQVNDTHGHAAGDLVLKEFARRCKSSVREIDLVGRYGGEELVILLPETDRKTSILVAERLRASIASRPIRVLDKEIAVTVSIGVATQDENTSQLETLIARADQAMYIAKHKGRNRVAMSK